MNRNYTQYVADSILPLSIADNLPAAFDEWYFTGDYHDNGEPVETCHLCGKEELRYHFKIENQITCKHLWVGSHCILKFNLAVYDNGEKLSQEEAKKKLNKTIDKMRLESCLLALERLSEAEDNDILKNALVYYRKNKKLTPKFAFVVFWRLNENNIDHNPSFFKISLKRDAHKQNLREMETDRVHHFWNALTPSQRELAKEMGHSPPLSQMELKAKFDAIRKGRFPEFLPKPHWAPRNDPPYFWKQDRRIEQLCLLCALSFKFVNM